MKNFGDLQSSYLKVDALSTDSNEGPASNSRRTSKSVRPFLVQYLTVFLVKLEGTLQIWNFKHRHVHLLARVSGPGLLLARAPSKRRAKYRMKFRKRKKKTNGEVEEDEEEEKEKETKFTGKDEEEKEEEEEEEEEEGIFVSSLEKPLPHFVRYETSSQQQQY
uniref:Uncharacterized protein n=1 Tax=Vespula pensylvanica TaxID=30213 RepID=A0A834KBZ0_VESPE|nr:hypothetical protein H0235_015395 [Vespula pensylvanica]